MNIPRIQRAKIGIHRGQANQAFHPYHVDIDCERHDELSDEIVETTIARASGQKVHILENVSADRQTLYRGAVSSGTNTSSTPPPQNTPLTTSSTTNTVNQPIRRSSIKMETRTVGASSDIPVNLKDEDAIREFIQSVRRDDDPTDWCLITYDAPKSNTLIPLQRGSGGIEEMASHLADNIVAYGLLRKYDQIDLSATVKFCFVDWRGPNIHFMQRAQLGTHSGFVTQLFHPYHVDIQTSDLHEINEEHIMDKIRHASGTRNYTRN